MLYWDCANTARLPDGAETTPPGRGNVTKAWGLNVLASPVMAIIAQIPAKQKVFSAFFITVNVMLKNSGTQSRCSHYSFKGIWFPFERLTLKWGSRLVRSFGQFLGPKAVRLPGRDRTFFPSYWLIPVPLDVIRIDLPLPLQIQLE
jgi:hypothetical protein